ncbi:MAG: LamG-like jellyroll fold domain-containing protein [Saprospiraceae bacterium]|nr:LamG-like jellyroll fold domain-containing protein [Saprospiraceae bacterium]
MKHLFLVCLIQCIFLTHAIAQQAPPAIFVAPDAPLWMRKMMENNPNVFEIQALHADYYRNRPAEKNRYTQFYKRWMHWARPYVQGDGSLLFPSPAEDAQKQAQLLQLRRIQAQNSTEGAQNTWTFAGPNQTYDLNGTTIVTWQTNIYSLDVALSNPNILYAGGESGGMWKTTDKGLNWTLLSANITHGAFGAVKIHPTDPNIVYAATGGKILKTTDGGLNWTTIYTENNLWVNEFAISTANPGIILAASDQGLLRSGNGGQTWNKIFTNKTWTVKYKPNDPNTVFAVRKNGSGSDFMKSTDGGAIFNTANLGWWLPGSGETVGGAIIAVCPSEPDRIYAYLCGNGTNLYGYVGVFRSNNAGQNWTNTHPANAVGNSPVAYTIPAHSNLMAHNGTTGFDQGFYDMAIVVNPSNANQLIAGGTSWFRSNDAGQTWTALGSYVGGLSWSHPDIQATVAVGNELWITSDGGINYSNNWASTIEARMNGISGADLWGFDSGWNEDILVGGRYHNGNMAYHQSFPQGKFYRMGGAEAPTGYVNPGPERKIYHSDIGGHILKTGFQNGVSGFSVGLFPNESYAYYANSEMVWHPACWNTVFLGYEQKIWKSKDGGQSWTALYTFPGDATNTVYDIEIARSNPQVMYCSQWNGTDDAIWRSADGGQTWNACALLPLPNNNDRVKLAVSAENANVLWASVTYGSNGKKIYKTVNGGQTWVNLTTALLNNLTITNIMAQYGTNGGIYLGTNGGIFYRNNTHTEWQVYSAGLPLSAETNRLKPFYRDGKIRNGCWGFGVWEAPLFEASAVLPQAMANQLESDCARDTFFFDDYSVTRHVGASWSWTFEGAQWVQGADTRTPKVLFAQAGLKQAIMTLSTPEGVFYDTLQLKVGNGCAPDSLPGQAAQLDGTDDYLVAARALNLATNTLTLSAWIKPNGTQNDWAGLVFCRGGSTTAGMSLRSTNELRYHWNDNGYNFSSGLIVPDNQWSHVAMVVTPSAVTLYVNGKAAVHTTTTALEAFDAPFKIGHDNGSRYYKGNIDEICIYNKALSQAEIRTQMHLTKTHTSQTGLISYYQMNESRGAVLDRIGTNHLSLGGGTLRVGSTGPFGPGRSFRKTVSSGKRHAFNGTGLVLAFSTGATLPNGELVVTRLQTRPDTLLATQTGLSQYWILDNYGLNTTFTTPGTVLFQQYGTLPADLSASKMRLWRRGALADGLPWTLLDSADYVSVGKNATVTFGVSNQIKNSAQFYLSAPASFEVPKMPEPSMERGATEIRALLYPNPVPLGGSLRVETDWKEMATFRLFDAKGNQVLVQQFEAACSINRLEMPAGVYYYRIENEMHMETGAVIFE